MEDHSDGEPISAGVSGSYELDFPTPQIHRSLKNICAQDMRPPPPSRSPSEVLSSSVDDFDIVSVGEASEGGLLSDDEDGRTESLASVSGRDTPDNVEAYSTDLEESEEEQDDEPEAVSDHRSRRSTLMDVYPSVDDSGYSAQTARPEYSVSQTLPHIIFEKDSTEPLVLWEDKQKHVFQSTDDKNTMSELSVYGSSHVGLSMHLTTSRVVPRRKGPFRLIVAAYNEHLVHDAALHIQQALEHVGIIKYPMGLVIERCRAASLGKDRRTIHLDIEDAGVLKTAPGGLVGRSGKHPTPDLALFLHPSLAHVPATDVEQMEETFARTRDAMIRCKVPIMDLSEYHPLFQAQPISYLCRQKSLYLQVEIGQKTEKAVVEQLPVDLDKFLAIDPETLGRHLACILSKSDHREGAHLFWYQNISLKTKDLASQVCNKASETMMAAHAFMDGWSEPARQKLENLGSIVDFKWASALILLSSIFATFYLQRVSIFENAGNLEALQLVSTNLTPTAAVTQVVIATSTLTSTSTQALSTMLDDRKTLDLIDERIKFWTQPDPVPRLSKMYEISTLSENNIIMLTPHREFSTTGKSQVQVSVSRDAQLLESQSTRLPTGSFVVRLEPGEAYGVVSIMINCRIKKARHYQGLTVDLGSPWLNAEKWTRAADVVAHAVQEDLAAAHHSARDISNRMTTGLQQSVKDLTKFGQQTKQLVGQTGKSFLQISAETAMAPWKTLQQIRQTVEVKEVSNQLSQKASDASQLVKSIQSRAGKRLRELDIRDMLPNQISLFPVKALARGQRNAKDLFCKIRGEKTTEKKAYGCGLKRAQALKDSPGGMFGRKAGKPSPKCGKK
ncbi:putative urea carboxylase [Venturia nashicola]|uniref:Putative urea carboxylase n=1 Tax=Venturia nashicola TaxID=86259 RepID=A0A4Z1NRC6_9PEZI|nr:putative urea carboxylase [Venturia nashicola]TLD15106.1 putative urea carboxylase [Venturia nashicola]